MYNKFINFKKEMIFLKVFIWFSCYFLLALFQTAARESGIIIGAIPLILLCSLLFWIAKKLCNYWDERQAEKSTSIASEAPVPEEPPASDPEPSPTIADPTSPAPATPKLRYCKLCGDPIDPATRKCSGCGKQYFRLPVLRKKHLAVATGVLACAAVVVLLVNLASQKNAALSQIEELTARISEMESTVAEKEQQIRLLQRDKEMYQSKLTQKSEAFDELRKENTMYREHLRYCEGYCAYIVPTSISGISSGGLYHRLNCPYAGKIENLVMIEIGYLESKGYKPCSHCYN